MLGTLYVWHGKGSLKAERAAALTHAQQIKGETQLVEVRQGKEDETFWMMLGEDFSTADYWQFRNERLQCDPRFFEIASKEGITINHKARFSGLELRDDVILLVDCVFEIFIIIGSQARGDRRTIRSALAVAKAFSNLASSQHPFTPPIHFIILPSQLPAELRMALRFIPIDIETSAQHMNILSLNEAINQLGTPSWARIQLSDKSFLPLGISPSML